MEKREQAYQYFLQGISYKEIAEKCDIPFNQVKYWVYKYWKNNNNEVQKRGAPEGNKNAVANKGGAPKGNKNNYKHGIYEKLLFEFLSEDEKKLFLQQDIDEEKECKMMIRFCDLQIFKFMRKIKELEQKAGGLVVSGVSKTKSKLEGTQRDMASDYTEEKVMTNTVAVHELILKYNNEIEKAKKQKMKCLEMLKKYKETQKQEQTEGSSTEMADMIIEAYKQRMEENKK